MSLERFVDPKIPTGGQYDRPEDELETPEVVALNKRERAFVAEGGLRGLLELKVVIEDINAPLAQGIFWVSIDRFEDEEKKRTFVRQCAERTLAVIDEYKFRTKSEALDKIKERIEKCKEFAIVGDWAGFTAERNVAEDQLFGMKETLNLIYGTYPESDGVRKIVSAPPLKQVT